MNFKDIAKEVLLIEADELKRAADNISDEMEKAVELIANAKGIFTSHCGTE